MGRSVVYVCDVSVEFEIGDTVVVIREEAHISSNTFKKWKEKKDKL